MRLYLRWIQGIGSIGLLFTLLTCDGTKTVNSFQLAFPAASDKVIHHRYLERLSVQWKSGHPPAVVANGGVGAAFSERNLMSIIAWTSGDRLSFAWGLGAVFDQTAYATTSQRAASAPVVASTASGVNWILAFQATDNTVAVRLYDHSTRHFTDRDFAPIENAANDSVGERPALTRLGTVIVLVWKRGRDLRFAVGTVDEQGIPTWSQKFGVTFPVEYSAACYGPPASPALASAGGKYYLAVRRSTVRCPEYSGEFLSRDDLFLYSSGDGLSWQTDSPMSVIRGIAIPGGRMSMAAWDDGTLLVGIVCTVSNMIEVYKYRNGRASQISSQQVFGVTPAFSDFSIYATKTLVDKDATVPVF
jgi:hypothetical protein